MCRNRLLPKDSPVMKPLHHTLAVLALALRHVRRRFRHMHVETRAKRGLRAAALRQRVIGQCERSMQSEHSAQQAFTRLLARGKERSVLFDALVCDLCLFPIRHFVAKATAQTGKARSVCDPEQT